jgi:hypothetical protein
MNIPGFTASTSLYNGGGRYRASANRTGAPATLGAVLPQMTRQQLEMLLCMNQCGIGDSGCVDRCYDAATIDGGGTGEADLRCRPQCLECNRDRRSRTGRSKICVDADCRPHTKSC